MATNVQPKHANFISRSVTAAQNFVNVYNEMVSLREEWDSLGYSSGATAIVDSDFTGNLAYLDAAMLQAFFVAQSNLVTYWQSGNGTNVNTLIP